MSESFALLKTECIQLANQDFLKVKINTGAIIKSSDEIGELADAFYKMAGKIQKFQKNMERVIAERTINLERSVEELERMNRIMVDREVRMAELKEEIRSLRKE